MKKIFICAPAFLIFGIIAAPTAGAHDGVTPAQVITDMKHQQKGPYAAPIFRGRNLSQDWLGFKGEDYHSNNISGVVIKGVKEDGPADFGDFENGDIITAVNGQKIASLKDLDNFLAAVKEPSEVEFYLLRNGTLENETIYLVPSLEEIAPEMADIMEGKRKPQPGMMMKKMIAKTPMGGMDKQGKSLRPGMFMEEMMERAPIGRQQSGHITIKNSDPLQNFLAAKLHEISLYKSYQEKLDISDEQLKKLRNLRHNFEKQQIKSDANLKIMQIDFDEMLHENDLSLNKLEDNIEELIKLNTDKHERVLELIKEYYSIIDTEKRLKLNRLIPK